MNKASSVANKTGSQIDVVDLLYEVNTLEKPDHFIDRIIDVMLANGNFRAPLTVDRLRFANWLAEDVPGYSAGGNALQKLAHKMGFRLRVEKTGNLFKATASNINTGRAVSASAKLEGSAGIIALFGMAFSETETQWQNKTI